MKNTLVFLIGIIVSTLNVNAQEPKQSLNPLKEKVEVFEVLEQDFQITLKTSLFEEANKNTLLLIVRKKGDPKYLIKEEFFFQELESHFHTQWKETYLFYNQGKCSWFFYLPNEEYFHFGASLINEQREPKGCFELRFFVKNLLLNQSDFLGYHECSFTSDGCTIIRIN